MLSGSREESKSMLSRMWRAWQTNFAGRDRTRSRSLLLMEDRNLIAMLVYSTVANLHLLVLAGE